MRSLITPSTASNEQASRLNWTNSSTASKLWVSSIRVATTSWNRTAVVGTPLSDRRANMRSIGISSPIVVVTRGPIHIMELIDRRGVEKEGVQRDVQDDDDRGPDQEGARQAPLWVVHFANDVGRGIPA